MKILVFIEHDIMIRHFVFSGVLKHLTENHDVTFVFPEEGNRRVTVAPETMNLGTRFRRLATDPVRLMLWKHLFIADQLRWRPGRRWKMLRRLRRGLIGGKAALLYSVLALPGLFLLFRTWSLLRLRHRPADALDALIHEEQPDILLHPSVLDGLFIHDLTALSATRKNIPLVVIMNSWDNPSTKRAAIHNPDWLLVWGPQTQNHGVEFLRMNRDRVVPFGAAQFDLYRDPPRIDRDELCKHHGINPDRRILLYAGSSKGSDEYAHLLALDEAIASGELANTTVIYRPHPWGGAGRGGDRILQHPWRHVVIEATMRGYLEKVTAGEAGISLPDYRDTHDLLSAIDALVSPLSTIILEGAMHGKPVACFIPDEELDQHFRLALPLVHFEDMFAMPEILQAHGTGQLLSTAQKLLTAADDPRTASRMRKGASHFVTSFDKPYGERLTQFMESCRVA